MREPAGLHRMYNGPVGTFYDAETYGPLQLEFQRVTRDDYRLLRRFGYRDHQYDEPFVCPHDVDDYSTDLASIPWFFQWVVPSRGKHFPAIMLHDALVADPGAPTHLGPEVDREEADRIMRDAMGVLGVGLIRRWLAWTGAFVATAAAAMRPRLWWQFLLLLTFGGITALGTLATVDLLDWAAPVPWMGERSTLQELWRGAAAAIIIPAGVSILWWKRWRAGLIGGVALALLLHVTLLLISFWAVYLGLEKVVKGKWTRSVAAVEADQEVLVQQMRVTSQVGKGSATFINLRVPLPKLLISVTGPQMLVSGLRLVTDLGILEGHSHPALTELASAITAEAFCGLVGPTETTVSVVVDRQGPSLIIGAGPASMYESVLEISTTAGETFDDLLKRTIGSGTGRGFLAGLVPIASAGHTEAAAHLGAGPPTENSSYLADREVADATSEELHRHGHA